VASTISEAFLVPWSTRRLGPLSRTLTRGVAVTGSGLGFLRRSFGVSCLSPVLVEASRSPDCLAVRAEQTSSTVAATVVLT